MADTLITPPSAQFISEQTVGVTERARRALKAFHRLRPQLSAFARVMTGNNTLVVLPTGGAPATDGKSIYIKPNLGLGDHRTHPVPQDCGHRDVRTGLLTCGACREHEEILVSLFHEIGHIIYESFEAMDSFEKERAVERAIDEAKLANIPERRIEKIRGKMTALPPKNYIEAAARISPFMPMLLNCLEDARVNDRTIKARPGMKIMFEASGAHILDHGVEQLDGKITKWSEVAPNGQALIGTFLMASGLDLKPGWLSDEVSEDLSDPELRTMLEKVRQTDTVREVYTLAFPVLERLRALGYCQLDEEQEEPEPGEGIPMPGDATSDQEDTDGDDDSEGMPSPGPSMADPFAEEEEDDDPIESEGDDEQDSQAPDEDEVDNENGQGGSWDSEERDDLGEDGDDEADDKSDDEADDAEMDDDGADDDDTNASAGEGDDAATDDEDGACDDASGDEEDDPTNDPSDDTGERDASSNDDPDDDDGGEWEEEDEDWGDDPNAGEASGEDVGGDEDSDDGDGESSNDGDGISADESYQEKGSPEDVEDLVKEFGGHEHDDDPTTKEEQEEEEAIERAIRQDEYFDDASDVVSDVNVYRYDDGQRTVGFGYDPELMKARIPIDERNIQNAVVPMRKAFSANKQGSKVTNLRAGKVNARALGKRAPFGDDRMFLKNRRPAKRDYHVVIGLDMSGSTNGQRLQRIKAAAYMQAELCNRVGVPFEVWGHTGMLTDRPLPDGVDGDMLYGVQLDLEMFLVKDINEPWNEQVKNRLWALRSHQVNLDGHTMEFYRKRLDKSMATDKLLIYYTDGEMPNFNYAEELYVLKRELTEFRKKGYAILGVGINTNSPEDHGLDTVAVYEDSDVKQVVMELEKRLA